MAARECSYQHFYLSQINRALAGGSTLAGLIEVNGPTGLGKTSALFKPSPEKVSSVLSYLKAKGLQGIFVTHRWNILHELIRDVIDCQHPLSVLYSRQEQLSAAVSGKPLPHESVTTELLPWQQHIQSLSEAQLWVNELCPLDVLHRLCTTIENRANRLERIQKSQNPDDLDLKLQFEQELGRTCKQLEKAVLQNMAFLVKLSQKNNIKTKGKRRNNIGLDNPGLKKLEQYRQHPWIRKILPAIVWRDEYQPLLVMTTHKFFNGFYDGQQRTRMGDMNLEGYVVFIDEFEYQEPVLLELLSQAQRVQELPQCLGVLVDEGSRLIARSRIANSKNEELLRILDELEGDFEKTLLALSDKGIDFPNQRALVRDDSCEFIPRYLFRSDYAISQSPTHLEPAPHGLMVVQNRSKTSVTAGFFLAQLEQLLRHTLIRLSRLPVEAQIGSGRSLRDEFMHLLFNSVNDYQSGHYHQSLNNAVFLGAIPNTNLPELVDLKNTNVLPHTQAHVHGFSCWMFTGASEQLDSLRIVQKRAHIPTTPEAILVTLASRNLVFGLSATSMIERSLGNFDMKWVYSALNEIARKRKDEDGNLPVPITPHENCIRNQSELIDVLKRKKASKRCNQLSVEVFDFTSKDEASGKDIADSLDHLPADFFQHDRETIPDSTKEHRRNCLHAMLEIMNIASSNNKHKGHLTYVNSIHFFCKWLNEESAHASRKRLEWFNDEIDSKNKCMIPLLVGQSPWFKPVIVKGHVVIICFLTAHSQKDPLFLEQYSKAFGTNFRVIIFTQVASATNGINLDFEVVENDLLKRTDLTCLYLYEARHFYFSVPDKEDAGERMASIGAQIRKLQKLRQSAQVSEKDYRHYIGALMRSNKREVSQLNNALYKSTPDFVCNLAADVQQQVGRMERVWDKTPETRIYIQTELAQTLRKYADDIHGYGKHKDFISTLNEGLLQGLQKANFSVDPLALIFTPAQRGEKIREIIDEYLVGNIRKSRKDNNNVDVVSLHKTWESIGRAALRRDLACSFTGSELGVFEKDKLTLKDWACIHLPCGADPEKGVWYYPDGRFLAESDYNARHYRLQPIYRWITHHHAITTWFNRHGYVTSEAVASGLETQYLFHPDFAQRILQGRIGEESIRALLDEEGITSTTELLHNNTLELYDFNISGTPLFIDAKYWGMDTQREADIAFQNAIQEQTGSQIFSLSDKVKELRRLISSEAKIVILNLVGSDGNATLKSFDLKMSPVGFSDASIFVLSSCLDPYSPDVTTPGFIGLCELIRQFKSRSSLLN
ncbi:hypothetical protein Q9290_09175 [Oceanimonas sp. CHS3-5]|uniref:hypothetical protein n=1 Tax=Oceanimonas sp. CHS3-5 TaxID=3068186 RepID=UPI00273D1EE6|nr:hypothetical protein [Oceanimonas sp. CHS3-5]MDP5292459.1 hypothetical protein [Oceanimonas sp. CHS3-5]